MIRFGKSKRINAISASQCFDFGQQRVSTSFHGKETSSGCCKRKPPEEAVVVGGPMEKRQKMDRCMTQQCFALLEELKKHPVAGKLFNQTFDGNPDYFMITRNPMDLGIIKSNLANNTYLGIQDFEADIRLAFYNAMLYTNLPLSNVHKMEEELNGILQARWKSLKENWQHQENLKVGQGKVSGFRSNSRRVCSKSNQSETEEKVVNVKVSLNGTATNDKVELPKPRQNCVSKLARKKLQKGMISNGSIKAKPPLNQGSCKWSLPSHSNHASSRIVTSERSLGGRIRVCNAADSSNKLDCHPKNTLTSEMSKSDPDYDGAVNALDNVCVGSQLTTPATDAASSSDEVLLTAPIFDVQMSPKKALHAAMLKSRFADTIFKAQQTILFGDKADPVKMKQEKEKLERRLREEKAKVEAHIRATEDAAKMKLEKQREAARIAIENMQNTAGLELNFEIEKEFHILIGKNFVI